MAMPVALTPIGIAGFYRRLDEVRAAEEGMDRIVVSNHGGRQLDGALHSRVK
jgi:isopentenyl diphosphate isomerase/L-lactate dehydrogenase-like FMN-dependent dehydrogenase